MTKRARLLGLGVVLAAIAAILLFPYQIAPPNAVAWLGDEPGLYFAGHGLAYGEAEIAEQEPLGAISIELWLRDRPGSRNWGPREIFSFYDGRASPGILIGTYGNQLFLFSRFEPAYPGEWFRQFMPALRLESGRRHFFAASYGPDGQALYLDGVEVARRPSVAGQPLAFSGRPVLGNEPGGRRGWWGEIRGLAIFAGALPAAEIQRHGARVELDGVGALDGEAGLLSLYAFEERQGGRATDMHRPDAELRIPARFAALPRSTPRLPGDDVPGRTPFALDPIQNVLLFLPLGALLRGRVARRVLLGFAFSLGLEGLQLLIPTRAASSLDVLWNTLGTAAGAALARRAGRRRRG